MKAVPNIISIFRICLVPVIVFAYFTDPHDVKYYAILVYAIAGLSDLLDGYLARKFDAQSKLGKLLDPLGDKLITFTILVCITITNPILYWAALVFFVKEILMGIGGLLLNRVVGAELPPSNFIGKGSTFLLFLVCVILLFFPGIPEPVVIVLASLAIILTLVALVGYLGSYLNIKKPNDNNGEVECNQQSVQDVNETPQ